MSWSNKRPVYKGKKRTVKSRQSARKKVKANGYAFARRSKAQMKYQKPKPKFNNDFERDAYGRIKGVYVDGFFIPD